VSRASRSWTQSRRPAEAGKVVRSYLPSMSSRNNSFTLLLAASSAFLPSGWFLRSGPCAPHPLRQVKDQHSRALGVVFSGSQFFRICKHFPNQLRVIRCEVKFIRPHAHHFMP
jgi:hypothetical protein